MKGLKTYRHESNPQEKIFHDKFIEMHPPGVAMAQIVKMTSENGTPKKYCSNSEIKLMITLIQWLGSPVGQYFLKECGFEKVNRRKRK